MVHITNVQYNINRPSVLLTWGTHFSLHWSSWFGRSIKPLAKFTRRLSTTQSKCYSAHIQIFSSTEIILTMHLNKVFFLARSTRCLNMHGQLHYRVGDRSEGHVSPRHENTGNDYGWNCKCKKSQVCKNNPWLAQRKALVSH